MDKGVSFKFKMTGENNITGKVVISKEAIATAHDQNNTFAYEKSWLNRQNKRLGK